MINLTDELTFKTSRSHGKGGQNVNKVSSKVELNFNIFSSALLTDYQKKLIYQKLFNKINKEGILQIIVQSERSQLQNKNRAIEKFNTLIKNCFIVRKKRIATKPGKKAKQKRLDNKKKRSSLKMLRSNTFLQ